MLPLANSRAAPSQRPGGQSEPWEYLYPPFPGRGFQVCNINCNRQKILVIPLQLVAETVLAVCSALVMLQTCNLDIQPDASSNPCVGASLVLEARAPLLRGGV
jgi:hypothetical protein